MFNYKQCEVTRSETTTFSVTVAPWEVPMLAAVNGSDTVKVVGDVAVDRPVPDAAFEYDRLATKYGIDKENGGQLFVSLVYGVGSRGADELAKEIKKADLDSAVNTPAGDVGLPLEVDPTDELFDLPRMAEGASAITE